MCDEWESTWVEGCWSSHWVASAGVGFSHVLFGVQSNVLLSFSLASYQTIHSAVFWNVAFYKHSTALGSWQTFDGIFKINEGKCFPFVLFPVVLEMFLLCKWVVLLSRKMSDVSCCMSFTMFCLHVLVLLLSLLINKMMHLFNMLVPVCSCWSSVFNGSMHSGRNVQNPSQESCIDYP